jgi:hypothetical protein
MAVSEGDENIEEPLPRPRRRRPGRPAAGSPPPPAREGGEAGFLPDLLRRGLTLGFTGFFMTEEALRRALGDSMPRDWMEFVVEQSERTRAELLDRLSREFGRVISAFDPVEILRRLLDGQAIEVTARIRLDNGDRERRREREREREREKARSRDPKAPPEPGGETG